MNDIPDYEKMREDSEKYFQSLKPVFCPAVNEMVRFSAESFNHIIYKTARRERNKDDQLLRFTLLPKAYELVSKATVYQEYEDIIQTVEVRTGKHKIKVILRKRGNSGIHFWIVTPGWTRNKYRDIKFSSTMKDAPEED